MRTVTRTTGCALAIAAATVFLAAPAAMAGSTDKAVGHCVGANACKGHSSCKTANNACKGQNSCKGQGFVELTKEQCDQVGGRFETQGKS